MEERRVPIVHKGKCLHRVPYCWSQWGLWEPSGTVMSADHDNGNIPRNIIAKARVKNALSVFIGQLSEFRSGRLQLGKILQETKTLNSSTIAFSDTQGRSFGSGENVWRRKFSRTGERAPGMLHLTNQFHHSFDCLSLIFFVSNQRTVSIALLSWSSYDYFEKGCRTIPKDNMEYDQYTNPNDCSCRTYFCSFTWAPANTCPWPLVLFFQISLKNSAVKTTHSTFRDCCVHFFRQPFLKKPLYKGVHRQTRLSPPYLSSSCRRSFFKKSLHSKWGQRIFRLTKSWYITQKSRYFMQFSTKETS